MVTQVTVKYRDLGGDACVCTRAIEPSQLDDDEPGKNDTHLRLLGFSINVAACS